MPSKPKPKQPATVIRKTTAPVHFSGDQRPSFGKNGFKEGDKASGR